MPKKPKLIQLDTKKESPEIKELREKLESRIVGQSKAVDAILSTYQTFLSGMSDPRRPVGNFLFLGPTGTGKTRTVEALAESLVGDERALLKVNCGEFQHSHEISKLIGCFTPDTPVLMADGSRKAISTIAVGDSVVTKEGRTRTVEQLHVYEHDGPMVELSISNHNEKVITTPTHEILGIRVDHGDKRIRNPKSLYKKDALTWIPAGELKKHDIVAYPRFKSGKEIPQVIDLAQYQNDIERFNYDDTHVWAGSGNKLNRYIPINEDFLRIAGYYVSDGGNMKTRKGVNFTLGIPNKSEALFDIIHLFPKLFGQNLTAAVSAKSPKCSRITISSRIISVFLADLFGDGALVKHVPEFFLHLPDHLLYHFLDAAIMCDGSCVVRRRVDYSTSSETLFSQMQLMLRRLGFATQMQKQESWRYGKRHADRYRIYIAGEQIEQFAHNLPLAGKGIDLYNPGNGAIQRMAYVDKDYIYFRVKDVNIVHYAGKVYDLAVEEDTSYVVEIIVHNSPPGYLGHRETHAMLNQESLNQYHTDKVKLSFVLFDEIEKASDALTKLLLGILDKATLTLGDNRRVDFSRTMIFMTSNEGAREIQASLSGKGLGYVAAGSKTGDIEKIGLEALRRKLSPEFFNRLDRKNVVVFQPLSKETLYRVLDLELEKLKGKLTNALVSIQGKTTLAGSPFFLAPRFEYSDAAKDFLLERGTDSRYGARPLVQTIQNYVGSPLAGLITTGQLGDILTLHVDVAENKEELTFGVREEEYGFKAA